MTKPDAPVIAPVLGNLIRQARIDAGLTQAQLAELVTAQQATISMWESGKQRPRLTQVGLLAEALGIERDAILAAVDVELEGSFR